jgi:hypothetical protein
MAAIGKAALEHRNFVALLAPLADQAHAKRQAHPGALSSALRRRKWLRNGS